MQTIYQQLKTLRQQKKLTQSELGRKLGLPQSHISAIEQGNKDVRQSTLTQLARVLDYELLLVPREQLLMVQALLTGKPLQQPRWQPDEKEQTDE